MMTASGSTSTKTRARHGLPARLATLVLALALPWLASCAGSPAPGSADDRVDAAHPLLDKIWSTGTASFVSADQLSAGITGVDFLLLGEVHDNVQHHELQARLMTAFGGPPNAVRVGFEQLDNSQAPALEHYLKDYPEDATGIGGAVDWSGSGWPDWPLYEPVFQQALDKGWQPIPLMFSGEQSRLILTEGYSAVLGEDALVALQPASALSAEQKAEAETLMRLSHCGKLPAEYLPRMVTIQTAKDAHMAWAQANSGPRGIMIVGDGHARKDRGVPLFLRRIRPQADIVVVSMVEVEPGVTTPAGYQQVRESYSDYVIFTRRQPREDPCAVFARQTRPATTPAARRYQAPA